jgi:hypothetical protein
MPTKRFDMRVHQYVLRRIFGQLPLGQRGAADALTDELGPSIEVAGYGYRHWRWSHGWIWQAGSVLYASIGNSTENPSIMSFNCSNGEIFEEDY